MFGIVSFPEEVEVAYLKEHFKYSLSEPVLVALVSFLNPANMTTDCCVQCKCVHQSQCACGFAPRSVVTYLSPLAWLSCDVNVTVELLISNLLCSVMTW